MLAVAQVLDLAGLMKDRRFRALVLLVTFASARAAMIYQHARAAADRAIVDALSAQIEASEKHGGPAG